MAYFCEALIPIREPWNPMFVRVRVRVRKKDDFCEGYKRLGMGQIRLGKNRKSCPGKTWFLRRVQASRTGSDPHRQFFRSQIRVLKKNLHKLRFANRNPSGLDPFLDPPFWSKKSFFPIFFCEKIQKSTPIYSCRKWSKWSEIGASRHLPCRVLSSYHLF